jgi:hypothetical protein
MAGFEVIIYGRFWVITEVKEPFLTVDHGDLLYDEKGLPK